MWVIVLDVNVRQPVSNFVPEEVFDGLRATAKRLASDIIAARLGEEGSVPMQDPSASSFRSHKPDTSVLQRLKGLKQGRRLSIQEVWDDQSHEYSHQPSAIADVLFRIVLTADEIEVIIRDEPRGTRPGPDGVPGEIYQRYASRLAEVFGECWGELLGDVMTDEMYRILAIKTWVPVPKYEGANRVEKLRHLEL